MVEPKSLKVAEADCAQYGREAVWAADEVSTPRTSVVFSRNFPESSRIINTREAAEQLRPRKLLLVERE
jgi:hypothetical protein